MVMLKNRFRGVKQNLKMARAFWNINIWKKFNKRNKLKFYNNKNVKKYNAREKKNRTSDVE